MLSDGEKRATYDRFGHAGLGGGLRFPACRRRRHPEPFPGHVLRLLRRLRRTSAAGRAAARERRTRGQDVRVEAADQPRRRDDGRQARGRRPRRRALRRRATAPAPSPAPSPRRARSAAAPARSRRSAASSCSAPPARAAAAPGRSCRHRATRAAGRAPSRRQRKVLVTFPPGIDTGQRLRVPGQGMPGPTGAPRRRSLRRRRGRARRALRAARRRSRHARPRLVRARRRSARRSSIELPDGTRGQRRDPAGHPAGHA